MVAARRLAPGEVADFRAMNALFADVFEEPENYAEKPPTDEYANEWLSNRDNVAILAEADRKPVGALAGYILPKFEQARSEGFIFDLAVLESHRRQGAATAMIAEMRRISREAGAWTVFVQADIFPEDEPAQALYRKLSHSEITALHFDIAP
ncbi:GNAT family N-acetyltransferase [Erythrobacter sp. THAF29]|uniref:GNAT family N-acetyltransferase n=1 Tax=Erythrobacter sp. THAF29 TaxID=2587851 RepID=UPI001268E866|nr:GNAT family N-acetyltransferase [Erythrobacter sp. THAF29]QFT76034.1 Acetyltransferase (GNAT) family protein [Erythrobacter sp. THAF29]